MSRSLTVAMVAACPYPTGQGTQALVGELARGLSARGHELHLICYQHGAFERSEPFPVHRTPALPGYSRIRSGPDLAKPLLDLYLVGRTVQVVRSHACSLIHAHNYEGALAGWLAARLTGRPLVYHAHNLMGDELPRYFERDLTRRWARLFGRGLDLWVPGLGDAVIVLHQYLADHLVGLGLERSRIELVPPGVELDFWKPPDTTRERDPLVAYCGNLDGYQNLSLLFEAMKLVLKRHPTARLVLATPNPLAEAAAMVVQADLGQSVQLVSAPDAHATRKVLHRCALAVCPRTSASGFPVKNLNAAAAGVPVVACLGGSYGVVHERSGLVVPDNDHEALANAIVKLLRKPDLRSMLGEAALALAQERYGLPVMIQGVEQVWLQLLGDVKTKGIRA